MQNVSLESLNAKVKLRWNGEDDTLVRLSHNEEKVEVSKGEEIEVVFERAKELLKYSPKWEYVTAEAGEVKVEDGRGKESKKETKAEKKAREAAEKKAKTEADAKAAEEAKKTAEAGDNAQANTTQNEGGNADA